MNINRLFKAKGNEIVFEEYWYDGCLNRNISWNGSKYIAIYPHWNNHYSQIEWVNEAIEVIKSFLHKHTVEQIKLLAHKYNFKIETAKFIYNPKDCPKKISGWNVITQTDFLKITDFKNYGDTYVFYGKTQVVLNSHNKSILRKLNQERISNYFDELVIDD